MAVRYNGPEGTREFKLRVRPGPEGLAIFKAHLKEILGFDVGPEFDVTFECQMPATGSLVTLTGLNAYGAATHCAALLAASKVGAPYVEPTIISASSTVPASPSRLQPAAATAAAAAVGASSRPTTSYSHGGGRTLHAAASTPLRPAPEQHGPNASPTTASEAAAAVAATHPQHRMARTVPSPEPLLLPVRRRPSTSISAEGAGPPVVRRACQTGYRMETGSRPSPRRPARHATSALYGSAPPRSGGSPTRVEAQQALYGSRGRARFAGRSASDTAVGIVDIDNDDDFDELMLSYGSRTMAPGAASPAPLPPIDGWTVAGAAAAAAAAPGGGTMVGLEGCQLARADAATEAAAPDNPQPLSPPSPPALRAVEPPAAAAQMCAGAAVCGGGRVGAATAATAPPCSSASGRQPPQRESPSLQDEASGRLRLPSILRSTARRTVYSLMRALRPAAK